MSYLHRVQNDTDAIGALHFDPVLVITQKESNSPEKKSPFKWKESHERMLYIIILQYLTGSHNLKHNDYLL
jgi:hypothetical protein